MHLAAAIPVLDRARRGLRRVLLLRDRREAMLGGLVAGIDPEDDLAHRDRLHEEAALHVALDGAIVCGDRFAVLVEPSIRLARALRPVRFRRLELLELEVALERFAVLALTRRRGGGI